MIPVTQTKLVSETQKRGNCLMASIASIMEKTLDEVPDLEAIEDAGTPYPDSLVAALHELGLQFCSIFPHSTNTAPLGYSVIIGRGARGCLHACVAHNGLLVHDPHPSRDGLLTVSYYLELFPVGDEMPDTIPFPGDAAVLNANISAIPQGV